MKIAIVCCTPFHILNALNCTVNIFKEDSVDIFVCDHFQHSINYFNKLKRVLVLNNIYNVEDFKWDREGTYIENIQILSSLLPISIIDNKEVLYDYVYISNLGKFGLHLYNISKGVNSKTKL